MSDSQGDKLFASIPSTDELMALYEEQQKELHKCDPTSVHYERVNIRPKLNLVRSMIIILVTLSIACALSLVIHISFDSYLLSLLSLSFFLIAMLFIHIKHVVIWLVKVYQCLAPEKVRNRCRYEPSCSNYMLLAIVKYGFWKGFAKGFVRWTHCKPPYGGHDEP